MTDFCYLRHVANCYTQLLLRYFTLKLLYQKTLCDLSYSSNYSRWKLEATLENINWLRK